MNNAFIKNLMRDIRKTLSRFLSIVVIIAIGVAFYAGVRATSPDMKMSGDLYFSKNKLMDFKIISTLGLTEDDLREIRKVPGILTARGSYSLDAVIEREGRSQVLNINSILLEEEMNEIRIVKGRRPENTNEVVVEDKFLKSENLKLGDIINLKSGNETKLSDMLMNTNFKIVGTASSPLYISGQRQLSSVGNGLVRGFVYILPGVFKTDAYTEIYARIADRQSMTSLQSSEEYGSIIKPVESALKNIGAGRGRIRYAQVIKEASKSLDKAREELEKAKKEGAIRFADAHRELEKARAEITKGRKKLEENERLFYERIEEGRSDMEEGKKQILYAETEINTRAEDIERGKKELTAARGQLDDAEKQITTGKQQAARGISEGIAQRVSEAKAQLGKDPDNEIYIYQYTSLSAFYENYIKDKDFDTMYTALKNDNLLDEVQPYFDMEALKTEESKITEGRIELIKNERFLLEGEAQIKDAIKELEAKKMELLEGEKRFNREREEGIERLNEGKKELRKGEDELIINIGKLRDEETKAREKFEEGDAEIRENSDKLADIKMPDWYVLGRSANVGYETYRQDSERINNIGKAFPLIFFLVASLVSLTTMTRMVQDNRMEIGTFKAMGYSSTAVVSHYLIYALSASIIGSLIGITIGFRLFPPLIINAYSSLYSIPERVYPFNSGIALQASLVAVIFVAAAAGLSAMDEMKEVPASLMRPKPPKLGKRILLERMAFLWNRMGFSGKVTARNIFRYKQRLFMTVIGIAACTSLMITGYGIREGITGATEEQFNKIYKYDFQASLSKNVNETVKESMKQKAGIETNIKSVMFAYTKNVSIQMEKSKTQDAYIIVPEDKNLIKDYIALVHDGKDMALNEDGVILTEKLARMIKKGIGDTVRITFEDKTIEARISGITEHYIQHYIYMSRSMYENLAGERLSYNSFYGLVNNTTDDYQEASSRALKAIKNVNSVSFKNNIRIDYGESMKSVNSVVLVLIVSAGVLAFVVIYNLTNINIAERRRELATIKLLGFYNRELAAYIYRENVILTAIGTIAGIFLGKLLNRYILLSAETNVIMFRNRVGLVYFLYSVIITIIFSMIVNIAMYGRFNKIDMIESLKSVE